MKAQPEALARPDNVELTSDGGGLDGQVRKSPALTRPDESVFQQTANLKVELQSKLDLARILEWEARRADLSEVRAEKISRPRNGNHTITAEVWRVERGVVEDVEKFAAELHPVTLAEPELLKQ